MGVLPMFCQCFSNVLFPMFRFQCVVSNVLPMFFSDGSFANVASGRSQLPPLPCCHSSQVLSCHLQLVQLSSLFWDGTASLREGIKTGNLRLTPPSLFQPAWQKISRLFYPFPATWWQHGDHFVTASSPIKLETGMHCPLSRLRISSSSGGGAPGKIYLSLGNTFLQVQHCTSSTFWKSKVLCCSTSVHLLLIYISIRSASFTNQTEVHQNSGFSLDLFLFGDLNVKYITSIIVKCIITDIVFCKLSGIQRSVFQECASARPPEQRKPPKVSVFDNPIELYEKCGNVFLIWELSTTETRQWQLSFLQSSSFSSSATHPRLSSTSMRWKPIWGVNPYG